jgi:autophagy-related protein 2
MVERLLPVLRHVSPFIHSSRSDKDATPHHSPARSQHHLPPQYVLDDLDAQASSIATLQPIGASQDQLIIRCPLVRLDIRCPAPVNRRGSWGDGAHLRSGIVTLDIHGLHATAKQPASSAETGRISFNRGAIEPKATVAWDKMMLFFARVPGQSSFLNA